MKALAVVSDQCTSLRGSAHVVTAVRTPFRERALPACAKLHDGFVFPASVMKAPLAEEVGSVARCSARRSCSDICIDGSRPHATLIYAVGSPTNQLMPGTFDHSWEMFLVTVHFLRYRTKIQKSVACE